MIWSYSLGYRLLQPGLLPGRGVQPVVQLVVQAVV